MADVFDVLVLVWCATFFIAPWLVVVGLYGLAKLFGTRYSFSEWMRRMKF